MFVPANVTVQTAFDGVGVGFGFGPCPGPVPGPPGSCTLGVQDTDQKPPSSLRIVPVAALPAGFEQLLVAGFAVAQPAPVRVTVSFGSGTVSAIGVALTTTVSPA